MTRKALALCALLAAACGDLDEVDVTRSGTATVPGDGGLGTPLAAGAIALDLALGRDVLEAEGIDPDDVDAARFVAVRLDVVEGTSLEAWLERIALHVEAPGLPRALVAERAGIGALPAGTRTVELSVSGVDLKPYVLAPTATVTAEVEGRQPADTTAVRGTATLRVDVNVGGLFD
jgi:hypothetical protein